jgi:adenosine deaminase
MRDLRTLPKTELHVHVEGSVRIETVRELAERNGTAVPHGLKDDGWHFEDPLDFIANYVELCSTLRAPEDFRRIGLEFCEDLASNGVRYAEAVFSPSNHAARMGDDWHGPIEAVLDGLDAGRRAHGVTVRLCPDVVRDLGFDEGRRVLDVALAFRDQGVVALGAAGSERSHIGPFAPLFKIAKDAGLRSVPHAGEWAGPRNVRETLAHYLPDRIGHGVRAIEDPSLVEQLADLGIPLEVSPVSNVATGVYRSLEQHPFAELRDAGVLVTLNSDDPPMFGAWTAEVYEATRTTWEMSDEELAAIAEAGVRASFADDETKRTILAEIEGWLAIPTGAEGGPL